MRKLFYLILSLGLLMTSCVDDDVYADNGGNEEVPKSELAGKLVLNEINGTGSDADKYIELYNVSDEPISLKGINIFYNNVTSTPTVTWTGTSETIAAKGFLLLKGTKKDNNPGHDLSTGLSGTQGIVLEIRDTDNMRIDYFTVEANSERSNSYARIPDGIGSWYFDVPSGTPGNLNGDDTKGKTPIGETPPAEVGIDYSFLVLNEVDGINKQVELYNSGNVDIPLNGVKLLKNEEIWWTGVEESGVVAPGSYVLIVQKNSNIYLNGASGISPKQVLKFELLDPNDASLGVFQRGTGVWGDGLSDTAPNSYQRIPNALGDFKMALPTPGAANASAGNEIPQS